jgi:hypothetical protein
MFDVEASVGILEEKLYKTGSLIARQSILEISRGIARESS